MIVIILSIIIFILVIVIISMSKDYVNTQQSWRNFVDALNDSWSKVCDQLEEKHNKKPDEKIFKLNKKIKYLVIENDTENVLYEGIDEKTTYEFCKDCDKKHYVVEVKIPKVKK